jgi:hypothetical protein
MTSPSPLIPVSSKGAPMTTETPAEIRYVWLAKKNQGGPSDVLGLFTSPERAKRVCQESANEYFGAKHTTALIWQGDDTYCSASYSHPGAGMQVFTVDMYELDKVQP